MHSTDAHYLPLCMVRQSITAHCLPPFKPKPGPKGQHTHLKPWAVLSEQGQPVYARVSPLAPLQTKTATTAAGAGSTAVGEKWMSHAAEQSRPGRLLFH